MNTKEKRKWLPGNVGTALMVGFFLIILSVESSAMEEKISNVKIDTQAYDEIKVLLKQATFSKEDLEQMEGDKSAAESALQMANDNLERATIDYENARILYDVGAISMSDFDRTADAKTAAEEAVRNAEAALDDIEIIIRDKWKPLFEQGEVLKNKLSTLFEQGEVLEKDVTVRNIKVDIQEYNGIKVLLEQATFSQKDLEQLPNGDKAAAESALQMANDNLERATTDYENARILYNVGAISMSDFNKFSDAKAAAEEAVYKAEADLARITMYAKCKALFEQGQALKNKLRALYKQGETFEKETELSETQVTNTESSKTRTNTESSRVQTNDELLKMQVTDMDPSESKSDTKQSNPQTGVNSSLPFPFFILTSLIVIVILCKYYSPNVDEY